MPRAAFKTCPWDRPSVIFRTTRIILRLAQIICFLQMNDWARRLTITTFVACIKKDVGGRFVPTSGTHGSRISLGDLSLNSCYSSQGLIIVILFTLILHYLILSIFKEVRFDLIGSSFSWLCPIWVTFILLINLCPELFFPLSVES